MCVCFSVSVDLERLSLTVDSHLSVAVFLQQELNVGAGRRDVLGPGSDSCTQTVSLLKQERKTTHRRPGCGDRDTQMRSRKKKNKGGSRSLKTSNSGMQLWVAFYSKSAESLVDVSCG